MTEAYLVDDDVLMRKLVHSYFREKGRRIWPFGNAADFLADLDHLKPAPIILDYKLPEMSGVEVMQAIRQRGVWWPVVMITAHADVPITIDAFKGGVSEFLQKPFGFQKLSDIVDRFSNDIEHSVSRYVEIDHIKRNLESLTDREKEVATFISEGFSSKSVAMELGISPRTVEIYRANIFRKMEVGGAAQLVRNLLLAA